MSRPAQVVVHVENGNVDAALKMLKKKMAKTGLLRLLKNQSTLYAYQKPSVRRMWKSRAARRRARKLARQQQRENAWIDGDRRTP
jgi:ribosomal protein S21